MEALSPSAQRRLSRRLKPEERPCYTQRRIVGSVTIKIPMPPSAKAPRVSAQQCAEAYERLGSVWAAGAELGIAGQTVHKKLKLIGHKTGKDLISDETKNKVAQYYRDTSDSDFDIRVLASEIERSTAATFLIASRLGIARRGRTHSAAALAKMKDRTWEPGTHPRGFAGQTHSADAREIMSMASRKAWSTAKAFNVGNYSEANRQRLSEVFSRSAAERPADRCYTRGKGGRRPDLGDMYFRSSWEANYARYLNLLKRLGAIVEWDYEQETFWFEGVRRGTNSYKPDFRVWHKGDQQPVRIEIKGYETEKDRTKWRRLRKYHPEVKLEIVGAKEYRAIAAKWSTSIPEWESEARRARQPGARP